MRTKYMTKVFDKFVIINGLDAPIYIKLGPHNTIGPDCICNITITTKTEDVYLEKGDQLSLDTIIVQTATGDISKEVYWKSSRKTVNERIASYGKFKEDKPKQLRKLTRKERRSLR